jgi:hypothetical protein
MQILLNILLYAFLAYWFYDSFAAGDYWYCFVVGFVITVAVVLSLLPGYHTDKLSPGEYPYDE